MGSSPRDDNASFQSWLKTRLSPQFTLLPDRCRICSSAAPVLCSATPASTSMAQSAMEAIDGGSRGPSRGLEQALSRANNGSNHPPPELRQQRPQWTWTSVAMDVDICRARSAGFSFKRHHCPGIRRSCQPPRSAFSRVNSLNCSHFTGGVAQQLEGVCVHL